MTIQQLIDGILGPFGVIITLLFIIYAGYKGWWVWGKQYEDMKVTNKDLTDTNRQLQRKLDLVLGQNQHSTFLAEQSTSALEKELTRKESEQMR